MACTVPGDADDRPIALDAAVPPAAQRDAARDHVNGRITPVRSLPGLDRSRAGPATARGGLRQAM